MNLQAIDPFYRSTKKKRSVRKADKARVKYRWKECLVKFANPLNQN